MLDVPGEGAVDLRARRHAHVPPTKVAEGDVRAFEHVPVSTAKDGSHAVVGFRGHDHAVPRPRRQHLTASGHTPRQLRTPLAIGALYVLVASSAPGTVGRGNRRVRQFVVGDAADVDHRSVGQPDQWRVIDHPSIGNFRYGAGGVAAREGPRVPGAGGGAGAAVEGALEYHVVVAVETNSAADGRRVRLDVPVRERG